MTDKEIIAEHKRLSNERNYLIEIKGNLGAAEMVEDRMFSLEKKNPHLFEDLPY